MFFPFGFDYHHFLYVALPLLAISMLAQLWMKSAYAKYSQIANKKGITGQEAAYVVLKQAGIHDVEIEEVDGFLSDHYSPGEKKLRLSPTNYRGTSIAAVGVAAHEAGHAIQHANNYAPMVLRSIAVPMASIGSNFGYVAIMLGLFMTHNPRNVVTIIGFILLCGVAVFQLINLPVEIDASRRALQVLPGSGMLDTEETKGAQVMLTAAAMTYVAATIAALWEVFYWAMRLGLIGGRRRD
jgi:Zn-dependent membrane protease YugP